jgi:hypothetical protein
MSKECICRCERPGLQPSVDDANTRTTSLGVKSRAAKCLLTVCQLAFTSFTATQRHTGRTLSAEGAESYLEVVVCPVLSCTSVLADLAAPCRRSLPRHTGKSSILATMKRMQAVAQGAQWYLEYQILQLSIDNLAQHCPTSMSCLDGGFVTVVRAPVPAPPVVAGACCKAFRDLRAVM